MHLRHAWPRAPPFARVNAVEATVSSIAYSKRPCSCAHHPNRTSCRSHSIWRRSPNGGACLKQRAISPDGDDWERCRSKASSPASRRLAASHSVGRTREPSSRGPMPSSRQYALPQEARGLLLRVVVCAETLHLSVGLHAGAPTRGRRHASRTTAAVAQALCRRFRWRADGPRTESTTLRLLESPGGEQRPLPCENRHASPNAETNDKACCDELERKR